MTEGSVYTWEATSDRGYSVGWNLKTLIEKGLPDSPPPKSLDELLELIQKLVHESPCEWGGPIAFNSLDNYIAPFLEEERPSRRSFIDQMENFYHGIKGHSVTISLDLIPRLGFPLTEKTQVILDALNGAVLETYRSQLEKGCFEPYFIINLYPETDWDSPSLAGWIESSYLFGEPTYQNFITGTISPETLRPRFSEPENTVTYLRPGGATGNSENQSVTGYSCINLEKIGSNSNSEEDFYQKLEEQVDEAVSILIEKREKIETRFKECGMPMTRHLMENLDWGFSVVTLVGLNEALESLIDAPLGHVAGKAVTYKVLERLLRKLENIQSTTNHLFSLESYPCETPGALLMEEYDSGYPYLTPSSDLKPSHGDDLWDVLEHQKKYHSMYTGGTLMQMHLEQGLKYNDGLKLLLKRTINTFGYNYLAASPVFSLCPEHGYLAGGRDCPGCDKGETFIRVDNKLTSVSSLPRPLEEAYKQRIYYDVKNQ